MQKLRGKIVRRSSSSASMRSTRGFERGKDRRKGLRRKSSVETHESLSKERSNAYRIVEAVALCRGGAELERAHSRSNFVISSTAGRLIAALSVCQPTRQSLPCVALFSALPRSTPQSSCSPSTAEMLALKSSFDRGF